MLHQVLQFGGLIAQSETTAAASLEAAPGTGGNIQPGESMDLYWGWPGPAAMRGPQVDDEEQIVAAAGPVPIVGSLLYNSQSSFSLTDEDYTEDYTEDELEIEEKIGTRKRGRKKGAKNKSKKDKEDSEASQRRQKNSQERKRVKNIRHQYNELRRVLGFDSTKKLCKQKVLDSAIDYITKLQKALKEDREEDETSSSRDLLCEETISTQSSCSSGSSSCINPLQPELSPVPFTISSPLSYRCLPVTSGLCSPPHFSLVDLYTSGWRTTPEMEFPSNLPGVTTPPSSYDSYISPPLSMHPPPLHHMFEN